MSNKIPCYVIEFGSRKIEFFPLLLKDVRELAEAEDDPNKSKQSQAYDRQFQGYLKSAQRGDPSITLQDIVEIVDTSHAKKLSRAIYSMPPENPNEVAANVPTSPQIGG